MAVRVLGGRDLEAFLGGGPDYPHTSPKALKHLHMPKKKSPGCQSAQQLFLKVSQRPGAAFRASPHQAKAEGPQTHQGAPGRLQGSAGMRELEVLRQLLHEGTITCDHLRLHMEDRALSSSLYTTCMNLELEPATELYPGATRSKLEDQHMKKKRTQDSILAKVERMLLEASVDPRQSNLIPSFSWWAPSTHFFSRPQLGSLSLELCALYEALKALRTLGRDDSDHTNDEFQPCVERIVVMAGRVGDAARGQHEIVLSERASCQTAAAHDEGGGGAGPAGRSGVKRAAGSSVSKPPRQQEEQQHGDEGGSKEEKGGGGSGSGKRAKTGSAKRKAAEGEQQQQQQQQQKDAGGDGATGPEAGSVHAASGAKSPGRGGARAAQGGSVRRAAAPKKAKDGAQHHHHQQQQQQGEQRGQDGEAAGASAQKKAQDGAQQQQQQHGEHEGKEGGAGSSKAGEGGASTGRRAVRAVGPKGSTPPSGPMYADIGIYVHREFLGTMQDPKEG
ncbi:hypothetical protein DUNSADRAFT_6171 [Dunaliella salina]|uniref:Uncharacterized protein n=1 Tax=Dunaliella salina TaxID=3046 RepID=A0ABQ7GNV2_DUNSA|nr:hypothetical protein DUNSADRAFT_6171 [Dunaliella salina]|eukprot:KAF5836294.1 hypothetical protein DUNSADRAFT_6171 [Dunaliella salina]